MFCLVLIVGKLKIIKIMNKLEIIENFISQKNLTEEKAEVTRKHLMFLDEKQLQAIINKSQSRKKKNQVHAPLSDCVKNKQIRDAKIEEEMREFADFLKELRIGFLEDEIFSKCVLKECFINRYEQLLLTPIDFREGPDNLIIEGLRFPNKRWGDANEKPNARLSQIAADALRERIRLRQVDAGFWSKMIVGHKGQENEEEIHITKKALRLLIGEKDILNELPLQCVITTFLKPELPKQKNLVKTFLKNGNERLFAKAVEKTNLMETVVQIYRRPVSSKRNKIMNLENIPEEKIEMVKNKLNWEEYPKK